MRNAAVLILILATGPSVAAAQADPTGVWELEVSWPRGSASVILAVEAADTLHVTWTGPQGQLTGRGGVFKEGILTFALSVEDQNGQQVELRFEGRMAEDTLTGRLRLPNGRDIAVSGRKKVAPVRVPEGGEVLQVIDIGRRIQWLKR
jgi:hypothetical protein